MNSMLSNVKYIFKALAGYLCVIISRYKVKHAVGESLYKHARSLRIVSFPDRLSFSSIYESGYAIEKILNVIGLRPNQYRPTEQSDIVFNWQDMTSNYIDTRGYLDKYSGIRKKLYIKNPAIVINSHCIDISKSLVGRLNYLVFGYALDVDPSVYFGDVVCKSDDNATHDGQIIQCPISEDCIRPGMVYSVLINNTENDYVIDFRIPYVMGFCGFFYEKKRPIMHRFSNKNSSVIMRDIKDEFTEMEVKSISKFLQMISLDYGELDVLRDKNTGNLYVVDVSKTPFGPPNGLSYDNKNRAVELMAVAFIKNVVEKVM